MFRFKHGRTSYQCQTARIGSIKTLEKWRNCTFGLSNLRLQPSQERKTTRSNNMLLRMRQYTEPRVFSYGPKGLRSCYTLNVLHRMSQHAHLVCNSVYGLYVILSLASPIQLHDNCRPFRQLARQYGFDHRTWDFAVNRGTTQRAVVKLRFLILLLRLLLSLFPLRCSWAELHE